MGAFIATMIVMIVLMLLVTVAGTIIGMLSDPTTTAAFEVATAETATVGDPVVTPTIAGGVAVSIGAYLFWVNRHDPDRYALTTVGVRPRVTREAVHADEPCTVCDAAESHERARAAKAVVVAGAVVATYDSVENYYCDRHANRETLEQAAAEPAPAVATDGGTTFDAAADEITDTPGIPFEIVVGLLVFILVGPVVLAVSLIAGVFGVDLP